MPKRNAKAKVYRRNGSKNWYFSFKSAHVSTGRSDEKEARIVAEQLRKRLMDVEQGISSVITVDTLVPLYIQKRSRRYVPNAALEQTLNEFQKEFGRIQVALLNMGEVNDWVDKTWPNANQNGLSTRKSHIKACILGCKQEVKSLPCFDDLVIYQREAGYEALPKTLWQRVIDSAVHPRFQLIVKFGFLTGARSEEIQKMKMEYYQPGKSKIVFPKKGWAKKSKLPGRHIWLHPKAVEIVESAIGDRKRGLIFRNASDTELEQG